MPTYKVPMDEIRFLLEEVLDVGQLAALPGYEEATPDLLLTVLEEGARLSEEVLAPLNQKGDAEGCRLEKGRVVTPTGRRTRSSSRRPPGTASPRRGRCGRRRARSRASASRPS